MSSVAATSVSMPTPATTPTPISEVGRIHIHLAALEDHLCETLAQILFWRDALPPTSAHDEATWTSAAPLTRTLYREQAEAALAPVLGTESV